MLTIKAYTPEGATRIYEAVELNIAPNKQFLEFIRPQSDLTECLLISPKDFSIIYIENQAGKTIESLRGAE